MRPFQLTFISVVAVVLVCLYTPGEAGDNLALDKPAWQSSTKTLSTKPYARKAVDGNTDSTFSAGSCTHTKKDEAQSWWAVDLEDAYYVYSVTITNRGDCNGCGERLRDFNIALMSSPPNEVVPQPEVYDVIHYQEEAVGEGETVSFLTDDTVSGRYLVIQLLGDSADPLTLCEVQVLGGQQPVSGDNLALGKPARQSSTKTFSPNPSAGKAVDGNTDSTFSTGSCTHTKPDEAQSWWAVELEGAYYVYWVTITNRGDCCAERLSNFNIALMTTVPTDNVVPRPEVYEVIYHQTEAVGAGETVSFATDHTVIGRTLVIQLLGDNDDPLTLCEVEVYGAQFE